MDLQTDHDFDICNRSSAVAVRVLVSRGRQANPVLTYETALRRFWGQSALFMGKWRTSGTQLRGRCAETRHAAASLRVPGYVRVSSLRDEMCLSGCLCNRSSAVSLCVTCEAFARTKKAARFSNRSSPMYKLFIGASMAFQTKGQTNRNAVNIDVYSHKIRE